MTLTKALVRWFEQEQRTYGTEVALFNLLWRKATADMQALGVTRVRTDVKEAR
jgi:hypothetical protein